MHYDQISVLSYFFLEVRRYFLRLHKYCVTRSIVLYDLFTSLKNSTLCFPSSQFIHKTGLLHFSDNYTDYPNGYEILYLRKPESSISHKRFKCRYLDKKMSYWALLGTLVNLLQYLDQLVVGWISSRRSYREIHSNQSRSMRTIVKKRIDTFISKLSAVFRWFDIFFVVAILTVGLNVLLNIEIVKLHQQALTGIRKVWVFFQVCFNFV